MKRRNFVIICVVLIIIFVTLGIIYLINTKRNKESTKKVLSTKEYNTVERNTNTDNITTENTSIDNNVNISKKRIEEPEGAIHFSSSSFYINNIEEFNNLDLKYDEEQDIYYFDKFLNKDDYKKLVKQLEIVTDNEMTDERLNNRNIIIAFKKTNTIKFKLKRLKMENKVPQLLLNEIQESYGKGINGFVFTMDDTQYETFKIIIQK